MMQEVFNKTTTKQKLTIQSIKVCKLYSEKPKTKLAILL